MKRSHFLYAISTMMAASTLFFIIPSAKNATIVGQDIPASFSINSNGFANWSMDIEVPPGIRGIEPKLSVNYTSQNVSGMLGVGFDLEGLSEITRVEATVAQDGFKGGTSYDSNDRFALDGNRLMLFKGSTYGTQGAIYHTQKESWTKVEAVGQSGSGPQYFKVWTRKGLYFEYGNSPNAAVFAVASGNNTNFPEGSIREWLVNKCVDLNGNTLTISYTDTPSDSLGNSLTVCSGMGVSYPSRIDYTSNGATKAMRSVQFYYEPRPDTSTCYLGGGQFSMRARMAGIRTFVEDPGGDSTLVREVLFGYDPAAPLGESRMITTLVKSADVAYAPTHFTWSNGQDTLLGKPVNWTGNANNIGFIGDFNGDGRSDVLQQNNYVYFGTNNGFQDAGNSGIIFSTTDYNFVGDFNGDGISDFLDAGTDNGTLYFYDATAQSFTTSKNIDSILISEGCYPSACVWQGDYNGDGLGDICSALGGSVYMNFGDPELGLAPYKYQSNLEVMQGNTFAADFTGDGLTDLFTCNADTGYLTISNWSVLKENGFLSTIHIPNMQFTISSAQAFTWVADYNGDGMADILAQGSDQVYRIYHATGKGFTSGDTINIDLNTIAVWPADYNHDGRMDFYAASSNQGIVYLSNGIDFSEQENINYDFTPQYTWMGDFNGDGLTDMLNAFDEVVYYGGNSQSSNNNINQQGNLVTQIDNGIGSITQITYKPITDTSVYTPNNVQLSGSLDGQKAIHAYNPNPLSPVQNQLNTTISIQQAMFVVAQWSETDGRGSTYNYRQTYTGAAYNTDGYGFLGYKSISSLSVNTSGLEQTFYEQAFPFTGLTDSSITKDINGHLYSSISNIWIASQVPNSSNSPIYLTLQKGQNSYIYNGQQIACASVQENWFDPFGNVQKSSYIGNKNSNATLWTFSTYDNDTVGWQIGYLTATKQTSDAAGNQWLSAVKLNYNAQWAVDSVSYWFSSNNAWLSRTFGYDGYGNQIFQTNYSRDTSISVFDTIYHSFLVQSISPPNAQGVKIKNEWIYEPFYGNLVITKDPNGHIYKSDYDGLGRFKQGWVPDSTGALVPTVYMGYVETDTGSIVMQINRHDWAGTRIDTSYTYYDGLNRNYKSQQTGWNQQAVIIEQHYNSDGQVIAASLPYFAGSQPVWGTYDYDPSGRVIRNVAPFGNGDSSVTKIIYQGLNTTMIRAAGTTDSTVSTYSYTFLNSSTKVTQFKNANGETTNYGWDVLGRLVSTIDASGNNMSFKWNSFNENDWVYSVSQDTTFRYFQPLQKSYFSVNSMNDTVAVFFDNLGRLTSSKANGMATISFSYDLATTKNGLGELCLVTQDNGKTQYSYAYDNLGNVNLEQTQLDGKSWQQTSFFNPDLTRGMLISPNAQKIYWNYDQNGELISIAPSNTSQDAYLTLNSVNAQGNWTSYAYGNGLSINSQYFNDGSVQDITIQGPNQSNYWSKGYQWTKTGFISAITDQIDAAKSENYAYSPTGRLLKVTTPSDMDSLAYDKVGNLVWNDSVSFTYSGYQARSGQKGNQTVFSAQYNATGQQYNRTVKNQNYKYGYNAYGQLDSVYRNDTLVAVYTYDFLGSRNRVFEPLTATTRYQVFGNYGVSVTGTEEKYSLNIGVGNTVIASEASQGQTYYYSNDQNNSTVLVTDDTGNLLQELDYAPYGKSKEDTDQLAQYKYNGKEYDENSGLYYFNFRYYDPFSCRFNSSDDQFGGTLTTPDALNNYAFAANSPITFSDPTGHMPKGAKIAVGITAIVALATIEAVALVATDGGATSIDAAVDEELIADGMVELKEIKKESKAGETVVDNIDSQVDESKPSKKSKRKFSALDEPSEEKEVQVETRRYSKRKRTTRFENLSDILGAEEDIDDVDEDGNFTIDKRRPAFRAGQREQVWRAAMKNKRVRCGACGKRLFNTRTYKRGSRWIIDWQMGHRPGFEFKYLWNLKERKAITEEMMVLVYQNPKYYRPECPPCNLSHAHEASKSLYDVQEIRKLIRN